MCMHRKTKESLEGSARQPFQKVLRNNSKLVSSIHKQIPAADLEILLAQMETF